MWQQKKPKKKLIKKSIKWQANTRLPTADRNWLSLVNHFSCRASKKSQAVQELESRPSPVVSSNPESVLLSRAENGFPAVRFGFMHFQNLICSYGNSMQTVQRWILQIFKGTVGQSCSQIYSFTHTQLCKHIDIDIDIFIAFVFISSFSYFCHGVFAS